MNRDFLIKEIERIIRKYLSGDYKVLLFGSWAKGTALENSDVDIGILGKEKVPWNVIVRIKEEVERLPTLRSIDIVDLNTKEERFKQNVLQYAKTLG